MTQLRVLGPIELSVEGRAVDVAALKHRAVLALLMLRANEVVSVPQLLARVWGVRRPPTAVAALRNGISSLRRALRSAPGVELRTVDQGYLLQAGPEHLDVRVFDGLVQGARLDLGAGRAGRASRLLTEALGVWRGPALADLQDAGTVWPEAEALEEQRLRAVEDRIDADLALGHHRQLVAELAALTREHPGREALHRHQMVALYRSGRQVHALAAYHRARTGLQSVHGRGPTEALHDLHQAVLEQRVEVVPEALRDSPAAAVPPLTLSAAGIVGPVPSNGGTPPHQERTPHVHGR